MGNTGNKIILTLKELANGVPTGQTKVNTSSDPDYIAPYLDIDPVTGCPIVYNTDCPTDTIVTGNLDRVSYEFSLSNEVTNNPTINTILVILSLSGSDLETDTYTLPNTTPNYFSGVFLGLDENTTYDVRIEYRMDTTVIQTCNLGSYST